MLDNSVLIKSVSLRVMSTKHELIYIHSFKKEEIKWITLLRAMLSAEMQAIVA